MARTRLSVLIIVAAARVAAAPVCAQRLSLADRVTRLEQQAAQQNQSQQNLELLNRLTELQAEVQSLRALLEQLQNENEQLKQRNREQYLDLDSRLQRLEGGGAPVAPAAPASATPSAPARPAAAAPAGQGFEDVEPAGGAPAAAADPASEQAEYDAALKALVERFEADQSARAFNAFLRKYPESPLAANAWYWLGESYYVTQNYEYALEAFQTVLGRFGGSRKEADAQLKLGYCQLALGQREAGEATLMDVMQRHAGSEAAVKAESRLRSLSAENR